jgi:hypothetical protein
VKHNAYVFRVEIIYSVTVSILNIPILKVTHTDKLRAERPEFNSWQKQNILLYYIASRSALETTESFIDWVKVARSPGIKGPGLETDHSPPSSAVVNNNGAIYPLPLIRTIFYREVFTPTNNTCNNIGEL